MRVLVTGGAGYIGSHTAALLSERGDDVILVDDLSTGHIDRTRGLPVIELDLADPAGIDTVRGRLVEAGIESVIHFAARKQVTESIERPAWYYQQNVGGLANLLLAMERAEVNNLVFSSSAAVYGEASGIIDEDGRTVPISPYGATKLVGEQMIASATRAWGLSASSLRYFNVGGAGSPDLGDTKAFNLIPIVLDCVDAGRAPVIHGGDYGTPDGTCVRDYVHVGDVAEAHLAVLDTANARSGHRVFNVGTGSGTSVLDIVSKILDAVGSTLSPVIGARREGDAPEVVAVVDRIEREVGWSSRFTLDDIVESAVESRAYFAQRNT